MTSPRTSGVTCGGAGVVAWKPQAVETTKEMMETMDSASPFSYFTTVVGCAISGELLNKTPEPPQKPSLRPRVLRAGRRRNLDASRRLVAGCTLSHRHLPLGRSFLDRIPTRHLSPSVPMLDRLSPGDEDLTAYFGPRANGQFPCIGVDFNC